MSTRNFFKEAQKKYGIEKTDRSTDLIQARVAKESGEKEKDFSSPVTSKFKAAQERLGIGGDVKATFRSRYQDLAERYNKAADSYHRAYQKDTGGYVPKSLASDRYTIIQGHKLNEMNKEIKTLLSDIDGMAGELDSDWINEAKKNLTQMDGNSNAMWNSAKESKDYWNSFANEDEYNTYTKVMKAAQSFSPDQLSSRESVENLMAQTEDTDVKEYLRQTRDNLMTMDETRAAYTNAANSDEKLYFRSLYDRKATEHNAEILKNTKMDGEDISVYEAIQSIAGLKNNDTGIAIIDAGHKISNLDNEARIQKIKDKVKSLGINFDDFYSFMTGEKNYSFGNTTDLIFSAANHGLATFNKGLAATADLVLGKPLEFFGWKDNPLSEANRYYTDSLNNASYDMQRNIDKMGGKEGASIAAQAISGTVAAIPDALLAWMSGGTSSAATASQLSTKAAYSASNTIGRAGMTVQSMMKNPFYWTSFAREYGMNYEEAVNSGANETVAMFASTISSLINAGIEIGFDGGSGIQGLPDELLNGDKNAIRAWVESAIEEGGEELLQGAVNNLVAKFSYDPDKPWTSYKTGEGVFDLASQAEEFGMGALVGGILGGGQTLVNAPIQYQADQYNAKMNNIGKYTDTSVIDSVKQLGLSTDPNSRAYHMAQGLSAESKNLYKGATIAEVLNEVYGNQTVSVVEQMLKDGGYEGKNLTETAREFLSSAENNDMSRKVVRAIGDNVELMKVWQKLTNSALIDTDAIAASLKEAGIQEKHAGVLARTMALSAQNKTSDSYLESFLGNEKVAEIYKEVQNEIEQGKTAERFIPNEENRLGAKMIEERLLELAKNRVDNEHKQQINGNQNQTGISDMPSPTNQQIADIQNVKITDNGQIMVETDSGEANLFDLPLPDDSIDVIANSVKYGDSAKTFFTSFIHGQDPTKYDQNFFRIYLMAGEGFSLEQIGKAYPEVFDGMFPTQIEMAFRSGYYDRRTHVQQAHEAIKKKAAKAKESGAKARSGAVDTSVVDAWMKKTGNRLTKKQKAEIEAGRVIASEIGIDVKYVVNFQDANGKKVGMIDPVTGKISGANGEISFREETGKIEMILDINAGLSNFTTKEGQASILRAMSHELTHFIEKMSPRMYQDLQEFMIQNIDFGEDSFHGLVAQKMESLKISETQAIREVIANACETMLGDSDVMTKLYEQNAGLGDRIRNWLSKKIQSIDRAVARIREIFRKAAEGDTAQYAESKALTANLEGYRQALQKWETALLDAAQNYQNGGLVQSGDSAQYSIRYTTDNRPVVVVQEDILDGVPKSQWVKTVKDTISGKFANGIPVKGRLVKVNAVTRNEYMNSKYTKRMFKSGNNIYADKLKSANNLDEIILASTNYINEDLKHVRKDNFKEFARGDILLRVGNHDYSAKVIIGITPKNNMVLYDIINFTQTSISLKNKRDSRKGYAESRKPKGYAESRKPMPDGVSFDSSISQNDSDVNNQYMQNRGKNSEQFVKYSIREGMTDDERYTELKNKTIQIPKSVDTKPYRQNLQQIENKAKSKAEKIIYSLAEELGILNRKLSAPELEMEFTFTKNNGLKESLSKQIDYGGNYSDFAKALLNLDNILKNAVLIERHKDKYKGTRRENIHLENVSVLLGAFRDGNVIIPVQFEIKKNRNADSKLYVTVAMTKIEAGVMGRRAAQNRAVPNLLPASEYSIAKILSKVNPQDRNFLKYVPDGFLNRTQKKAKDLAIADENEKINALYSEREYTYEELTAKPDMKVTEIDDSATYTANSETRKQIVSQAIKNAASVGYTNENGNAVVHVKDIDTDVIVSKKAIQHSLDRRLSINAPVVEKVGEILSHSIKINELNPRTDNIEKSYVLIGMAKNTNKEPYVVSFVVNGYTNEISSFDVLYSVNAKTEPAGSLSPKASTPSTDSTISISQLLETVNRYFPDILPESVLRHFGHEARPDGTLGQSALYSEREVDPNRMRTRLSHIMENAAIGKKERALVKEYQKQNEKIRTESNKLYQLYKELNVYYKEAVDSNQTYHPALDQDYRRHLEEQISSLQEKIKKKELRIKFVGRRLLQLKAMQPIQDIIEKDKRAAAEEHRKKLFEKEYREKKIRKIQTTVKRINRLLTKPDGTKNVKDGLQKESMKFMRTFLNDTSVFNKKQLDRLSEFYKKIDGGEEVNSGNTGVYNEDIQNTIDELRQTIAGKRLSQLSKEELEKTGELVDHFSHIIKTENEVFIEGKRQNLDETAFRIIDKLNEMNDRKENQFLSRKTVSEIRNLLSSKMTTPVYFFEKIPGFEALYHDLLKAQDQKALLLIQAKNSFDQAKEKYHYYAWSEAKNAEKDFLNLTTSEGKSLTISREEALFLYATDKREQSNKYQKAKHLSEGGILMENGRRTIKQGKLGRTKESYQKETEPTRISDSDMKKIKQWLTDEQKAYADAMVEYMSKSLSVIGNQTSMELFGIRIFDEPYYFPRSSAKNYLQKKNDRISAEGFNRLKYLSLARHLVRDANNPITVGNFTDTVVNHTNAMLTYGTFCTPIENLVRIWGYKFKLSNGDYVSVRQLIEAKFGKEANQYIQDFIDDIAGEAAPDNAGLLDMTVSTFKKTAVAANLSVIVQQPSAFVRAMMIIEPQYFIKALSVKGNYDRVKEIAPIAIVKEMGRFDTGVKMGTAEWLNQRNYKGFQEKGKAFFSVRDSSYRDDLFSLGASKADEITWTWIFKACEAKIIASKKFVKNSAAYKQAVRDLFTEVITKTQVYDSPLAKSALMRSNNGLVKLTTAFMAEPTVSFNMLYAAATSGNKAKIAKAIGCFVGTTFVNALLKSLVYAARDDDEDKKYSEKYLKSLAENFTGDLNPVNLIPVVRDIVSVLNGNDVKRIDMSLFADLRSAYDVFMKEDKEPWEKAIAVIGAVGNLFGIPLKNMIRLITSSVNLTKTWKLNRNPTADSLWYSTLEGLDMALDYKKMIKEIKKGDEKEIRKLIQAMIKYKATFGANEQDVKKAIKARLTTAFKTEYLAADTAGRNEIRRKIFATGVYEHLADLDKTLNRWKSEALKEK